MDKQGSFSGQQLKQRYQLDQFLGGGGMGKVYKAQDILLHRPVAVKVMSPAIPVSAAELQDYMRRFQEEALRLANLKHRGIPHIYEYFEEAGRWFLVMEFVEGETLQKTLEGRGGRLPVDKVLTIGFQLADVLQYLHQLQTPLIFRDLKPANVMIAPDGQVFLIDFGIARLFTPGKSQDTFVALSPGYAAPEQHGTAQTTVRSDIYSLGATLHHLLSGTHPASSPFLFAPLSIQQPPQLAALIAQMIAIDAAHRPSSMAEVKEALQRMIDQTAVNGLSTSTEPTSITPIAPAFFPTTRPALPEIGTAPIAGVQTTQAGSLSGTSLPPSGRSIPSAMNMPPVGTTLVVHESSRGTLAWSPDGQQIASGDYGIEIWNATTGQTITKLDSRGTAYFIIWSPDGKYIVACEKISYGGGGWGENVSTRTLAEIWKASGQASRKFWHRKQDLGWKELEARSLFSHEYNDPGTILWSPDVSKAAVIGSHMAYPSTPSSDKSWGPRPPSTIWLLPGPLPLIVSSLRDREPIVHRSFVALCNGDAVAWSPDGTCIAWGVENEILIWNVSSPQHEGYHLLTYREHHNFIIAVNWSSDGKQITSRSEDGSGLVWDANDGHTLATFTAPVEEKRQLPSLAEKTREKNALSPNGALKAVPTHKGIEIQTVAHGETVFVYRGHFSDKTAQHWSPEVKALSWSPDGTRVAFARFDGKIYVWQAI